MKNVDFLPVFVGDRFDLMALLKNVWIGRKIVFWTFGCFVLTGLLLALFSPVKYESTSVLLPQEEEVQELGQLGGLASLAGINLGDMLGGSNALSTDLYPNILGSYPFLQKLASSSFVFEDEDAECTLYDKLASEQKNSGALVKYTVGLPWTLKDWLSPVDTTVAHIDGPNAGKIVALSREDILLLKEVQSMVALEVDGKTGLVTVRVEYEEAYASAQIAQRVVDLLQEFIINYKTNQIRHNLDFVEARYNEMKKEFEGAQRRLFSFQDAHRNMVAERIGPDYQVLLDEYDISRGIYQNLAQQLEQTRLAVKKETPVFSVIEPVRVPVEKSTPRRTLILMVSMVLGGVFGFVVLYGFIVFLDVRASWKEA